MQLRLNELQGKASWMTATDAGGMPGRYSITNAWYAWWYAWSLFHHKCLATREMTRDQTFAARHSLPSHPIPLFTHTHHLRYLHFASSLHQITSPLFYKSTTSVHPPTHAPAITPAAAVGVVF